MTQEDIRHLVEDQSFASASPRVRKDQHLMWRVVIFLLALALSLFHLYTAVISGVLPSQQQRTFHVAFGLALVFLLYPASRPDLARERWTGWIVTALGFAGLG